jgi:hypothetical protein
LRFGCDNVHLLPRWLLLPCRGLWCDLVPGRTVLWELRFRVHVLSGGHVPGLSHSKLLLWLPWGECKYSVFRNQCRSRASTRLIFCFHRAANVISLTCGKFQGYYCPSGATTYYGCPAGYYCPASSATYTSCPAGYYCPATSSSVTKCAAGQYSAATASGCTACAGGTYQDTAAQSSCKTCPAVRTPRPPCLCSS